MNIIFILGGDNISIGYYKNEKKTKEEFFEKDGKWWFRTGDIGQVEDDGSIRIIGKFSITNYFFQ